MPVTLSLVQARSALMFESAYWQKGAADEHAYSLQDAQFQSLLTALQSRLNRVRLEMIQNFERETVNWTREVRASKLDEFDRTCEQALEWKLENGVHPSELDTERAQRNSIRRDGVLRTLIRNQFSQWLRKHGAIPYPEQIIKDFEGMKVDAVFYREVLGQLKVNRWRFTNPKHLATGGTAEVFDVDDREFGRKLALKQLRKDLAIEDYGPLIQNESQLTARLNYPGVPFVHGTGHLELRPFFVMELLPRKTLLDDLSSFHKSRSVLIRQSVPCLHLLRRLINVCEIVQHAHDQRIAHHDIKPTNILCGNAPVETYLIDWGFARLYDGKNKYHDLENGTPDYIAPERIRSPAGRTASGSPQNLNLDTAIRTDVYSLGATLYHLISGRSPFMCLSEGEIIRALKRLRASMDTEAWRKQPSWTLVNEALSDPRRNPLVAGLRADQSESNKNKIMKLKLLLVPLVKFPPPRSSNRREVDRELIEICRRAMHQDRGRRYQSAKELASRLDGWIVDAPNPDFAVLPIRHPFVWLRRHPRLNRIMKGILFVIISVIATVFVAQPQISNWTWISDRIQSLKIWNVVQESGTLEDGRNSRTNE